MQTEPDPRVPESRFGRACPCSVRRRRRGRLGCLPDGGRGASVSGMTHTHGERALAGNRGRLLAVFAITLATLAAQVAGSLLSGSLALLADAGHLGTDVAALGLALLAAWFAGRPASASKTFGYHRVEILAAAVNAVLLLGVAGFVLVEAWRRLAGPPPGAGGALLPVGPRGPAA